VKAIVEVALEVPGELCVLDVARVQWRDVSVRAGNLLFEGNDQFHVAIVTLPGGEINQHVIIAQKLRLNAFEWGHGAYSMMESANVAVHLGLRGTAGMALSGTVTVKLSSEEAGMISLTRVLTQEMSYAELLGRIVSVTGKDVKRIQRILNSGTLLDSATRFRWQGADATAEEIEVHLEKYHDPDPSLPFDPSACRQVFFLDARGRSLPLDRDEGSRRRFLQRRSLWDVVVEIAGQRKPQYVTYSYRDAGDRYRLELAPMESQAICDASQLLKNRSLARQLRGSSPVAVEFVASRSES